MFRWRGVLILASALAFTACDTKDEVDDDDESSEDGLLPEVDESSPYGPENAWWHADEEDVPADLEGTGYSTGDVPYNFTMLDQNGDEVELYQFLGQVVVLDVYAEW